MQRLCVADFPVLDFGDKRRSRRMIQMINNILEQPGESIPVCSGSWYDTKAAYNFFLEAEVSTEALQKSLSAYGAARLEVAAERIFVAHDISTISYNNSQARGLGYTGNPEGKGILCYSSLAISEQGTPLALLYQHTWTRKKETLGKARRRKVLPCEQKESHHWFKGITGVDRLLPSGLHRIHLADREADIYELFCAPRPACSDFLIRATHNRALEEGGVLWQHVAEQPCAASVQLEIPDSKGRKNSPIEAEVRFVKVSLQRPRTSKHECPAVAVMAIAVRQVGEKQPGQKELIDWKLLTSLQVSHAADALQCVSWYCYRWLIERFHYVLKSGTRIEALQLGEAESLRKAIHVYSLAAMGILRLVYQSRETPQVSCEAVLSKEQWLVLWMLIHKNSKPPLEAPTLKQAAYWIGRLGGHLGRKQDGPPGLKAVWTGYKKLCDALSLYEIMNPQNLGKG